MFTQLYFNLDWKVGHVRQEFILAVNYISCILRLNKSLPHCQRKLTCSFWSQMFVLVSGWYDHILHFYFNTFIIKSYCNKWLDDFISLLLTYKLRNKFILRIIEENLLCINAYYCEMFWSQISIILR